MNTSQPGSSSSSTVSTLPSSDRSDDLVILAAVLVIVLLTVAAIGLTILIYCAVKRRHMIQQSKRVPYRPVPTKDSIDNLNRAFGGGGSTKRLPFPPSLDRFDTSSIQPFTTASQISQPEISSPKFRERYPFIPNPMSQPKPYEPASSAREDTGRQQHKKRKGHRRGGRVIRRGETFDSENSAGATSEGELRDPSPLPSHRTGSPAAYVLPAPPTSTVASPNSGKTPEVFFTVRYDITVSADLIIKILKVDSLPFRDDGNEVDAYVRVYFTPTNPERRSPRRTSKTRTERRSSAPIFEEEIKYSNVSQEELLDTILHVEALDYKAFGKHVLLGKAELALKQLDFINGEVNASLPLTPPEQQESKGTILLSMCFDPDNRKLSFIILRAKDLNNNRSETDPVAKVCVELKNRILTKLKTKKKSNSTNPIFNEAVSCTVGMENIRDIKITVLIYNENKHSRLRELGMIRLGPDSTGDQLRHWNDVITAPGKHIAEWHNLH